MQFISVGSPRVKYNCIKLSLLLLLIVY